MSSIRSIEARIRADPDDDEAWQVYGDWLSDRGDRRGELIGLEARLARGGDSAALRAAIEALNAAHRDDWTPAPLDVSARYEWRRGFVHAATVEDLSDPASIQRIARLLADPEARLLTGLRLRFSRSVPPHGSSADGTVEAIAGLALGGIRALEAAYAGQGWGDLVARALQRRDDLALRVLDLRYAGLTNDGMAALADGAALRGLRALYLQHNAFGARGVEALAASEAVGDLELLDLRYNFIGPRGGAALARSAELGSLATLRLYPDDLDDGGIAALAASTTLRPELARWWRARREGA